MSLKNSKKTPGQVAGSIEQAPEGAGQPLGTGSVTTPASPEKPTGYQWDMLMRAKGKVEVRKIQEWAERNGFSPTGQFMKAVNKQLGKE